MWHTDRPNARQRGRRRSNSYRGVQYAHRSTRESMRSGRRLSFVIVSDFTRTPRSSIQFLCVVRSLSTPRHRQRRGEEERTLHGLPFIDVGRVKEFLPLCGTRETKNRIILICPSFPSAAHHQSLTVLLTFSSSPTTFTPH